MTERFTIVFEGDIRKFAGNPLKTETPFGIPYTVAVGDIIEQFNELQESSDPAPEAGAPGAMDYERKLFKLAEDAYFKAGRTSDPEDWLQAGLLAQQHRNALTRVYPSAASTVEPVSLRQMARRIEEALNSEFGVAEGYGNASWTVAHHLYAAPTTSPEPDAVREQMRLAADAWDADLDGKHTIRDGRAMADAIRAFLARNDRGSEAQ
jgi:hypothetical protein